MEQERSTLEGDPRTTEEHRCPFPQVLALKPLLVPEPAGAESKDGDRRDGLVSKTQEKMIQKVAHVFQGRD